MRTRLRLWEEGRGGEVERGRTRVNRIEGEEGRKRGVSRGESIVERGLKSILATVRGQSGKLPCVFVYLYCYVDSMKLRHANVRVVEQKRSKINLPGNYNPK